MGLFDNKKEPPRDPRDDLPYDDPQEELADSKLLEEQRARIEDLVAFNSDIIRPTRLEGSDYHKLLTKDLKVSNLADDQDRAVVCMAVSLIDHALFMGFESFAVILHAELIAYLSSKNSIQGFERKALITQIADISKAYKMKDEAKKGFRLG